MLFLNVIKANKAITELTYEKDGLLKQIENLTKDLTEAQDVIGNFMVEKEGFDKVKADLKAEYEAKEAQLNKNLEETKASVNSEASNIVAALGVEPDAIKVEPKALSPSDILSTFKSLNGKEQQAFYQENKATIIKALDLDK